MPITFFAGDNGSGKSTLLEAIAVAAEIPAVGSAETPLDDSLAAARRLAAALRLAWAPRSRKGFFLRAEDFFGYQKAQARTDARLIRERKESLGIIAPTVEGAATHVDEDAASRYLHRHDHRSHGEAFLDLYDRRVHPGGLYLLDEPEAALSPKRQIDLLQRVARSAEAGAQFLIASHSVILLSCPGACILSFDDVPIAERPFESLESVTTLRAFLASAR